MTASPQLAALLKEHEYDKPCEYAYRTAVEGEEILGVGALTTFDPAIENHLPAPDLHDAVVWIWEKYQVWVSSDWLGDNRFIWVANWSDRLSPICTIKYDNAYVALDAGCVEALKQKR